jgi:organic hydroperoxide reductase OsmC/OhrA
MEQLEKMHHQSHEQCFIANSVKTELLRKSSPNKRFKRKIQLAVFTPLNILVSYIFPLSGF